MKFNSNKLPMLILVDIREKRESRNVRKTQVLPAQEVKYGLRRNLVDTLR